MTILNEIISNKKREIKASKRKLPLYKLKKRIGKLNFVERVLVKTKGLFLIAEIKPKSPSAGVIRKTIDVAKLAKQFQSNEASAISVLTDKKYFGGSLKNLLKAKKATRLPILRKDFICDEYQLYESKAYGVDLILLIVAVLNGKLKRFVELSLKLNLQPLIEVHTEAELSVVLKSIKPSKKIMIGVNNRNLKTFKVDIANSLKIINKIPSEFVRVSESGIFQKNQLEKLSLAGFDGVLIGEGLAKNPALFNYFK